MIKLLKSENFQYKDTYFFIVHPAALWIGFFSLVLAGWILFYSVKIYRKRRK